jgi:hypothetical protein
MGRVSLPQRIHRENKVLKANKHLTAEVIAVIIMGTATFLAVSVDRWAVAAAVTATAKA